MADFDNGVVVEGGLEEWDADGLPVMRNGFLSTKAAARCGVGLLICAGLVLAVIVNDIDLFVALIFIAGVLLWRLTRKQNRPAEIFPLHTPQHRHA